VVFNLICNWNTSLSNLCNFII